MSSVSVVLDVKLRSVVEPISRFVVRIVGCFIIGFKLRSCCLSLSEICLYFLVLFSTFTLLLLVNFLREGDIMDIIGIKLTCTAFLKNSRLVRF